MKRLFLGICAIFALTTSAFAVTAVPAASSGQSFHVSVIDADTLGKSATPTIYNIGGHTYFKLRDLGRLLNIGVTYRSSERAVYINPSESYVPVAGESGSIQNTATSNQNAQITTQTLYLNGKRITPTVYSIKGNNYIGVRELGQLANFSVVYNYDNHRITAYKTYPYVAETTWTAAMNDFSNNLLITNSADCSSLASRYASIVTGNKSATWKTLVSTLRAVKNAPYYSQSSKLYRINLYQADKLTAGIVNSSVGAAVSVDKTLTAAANQALFANADKTQLQQDFKEVSSAYHSASSKSASSVSVSNSYTKDAVARFNLPNDYASARNATAEDEKAAKSYFSSKMATLSSFTTDNERVSYIYQTLNTEFSLGGSAFWTTAYEKSASVDRFSLASAANWMFYEAGIPSFIARGYSSAWNIVYVNGKWAVFDFGKGASLQPLDGYMLSDTNPGSTILLTQAMRPGATYYNSVTDFASKYFTYTKITGTSVATAAQMQAYIKKVNPNVSQSVIDMIPFYLSEGKTEGIRGDIAFAQSCLETGNFTFSGSAVTLEQNNFCGLGVVTNGVVGAVFDTPQLGIRAQVQHLKAYANKNSLVNPCIDPRFDYVTRGCSETLQYLGMKENPNGYGWAAGANYGVKILNILENILSMPVA